MLESFIIETRSKVSSDEGVEQVSQEEERSTIATDFEAAEDWLYEEGRDLDAAAYQKKKKELEKMTAPIFLRLAELEARPRVVTQANEAINWTLTILQTWATEASRQGRSCASTASSSAGDAGSAPPTIATKWVCSDSAERPSTSSAMSGGCACAK